MASWTAISPSALMSDGALAPRAPGEWGGIAFAGNAKNNVSQALTIRLSSTYTFTDGGTNDAGNSGNLQYVKVHFGTGYSTDKVSKSALILNSLGMGTAIDHVQITNLKYDGIGMYGGLVDMNNIVNYSRTDFPISYGYQGNIQFITAMRMNNVATPTVDAYGQKLHLFRILTSFCCLFPAVSIC